MAEVRELPLDKPAVTPPPRTDPSVRPLLRCNPRERVVRVDAVLRPRVEVATGLVPPAHVDNDSRVAALGEPDAPADEALARRLVRRPLHDRRQRAARSAR